MPGPQLLYAVTGFVFAGLAGLVAYAYAFAPPLVPASPASPPSPGEPGEPAA
jgi:hypothetical protein